MNRQTWEDAPILWNNPYSKPGDLIGLSANDLFFFNQE